GSVGEPQLLRVRLQVKLSECRPDVYGKPVRCRVDASCGTFVSFYPNIGLAGLRVAWLFAANHCGGAPVRQYHQYRLGGRDRLELRVWHTLATCRPSVLAGRFVILLPDERCDHPPVA